MLSRLPQMLSRLPQMLSRRPRRRSDRRMLHSAFWHLRLYGFGRKIRSAVDSTCSAIVPQMLSHRPPNAQPPSPNCSAIVSQLLSRRPRRRSDRRMLHSAFWHRELLSVLD